MTALTKNSSRPFHRSGARHALFVEGVSLDALAKQYGTPLYVYSATQIIERLNLFQRALASREHLVCYAVKANSSLTILKLLAERGAGFDIVSIGELARIMVAAPDSAGRIVFSGVGKTELEVHAALLSGILQFNVESESELQLLAKVARRLKRRARFALRVNPDVFAETHPYISTGLREHKFGIDIRKAAAIYRAAARNKWLEPHGVSVHIGSQISSAAPFGAAIERVSKLVKQLKQEGIALKVVDAGGGLGINYHGSTESADPAAKVAEYAGAIEKALAGFEGKLLIEPGRFIVAQAGALLTRVLDVKRNGRKNVCDHGCRDERPDPAGALPGVSRNCADAVAAGPCACGGRGWTGVRNRRLLCARSHDGTS